MKEAFVKAKTAHPNAGPKTIAMRVSEPLSPEERAQNAKWLADPSKAKNFLASIEPGLSAMRAKDDVSTVTAFADSKQVCRGMHFLAPLLF